MSFWLTSLTPLVHDHEFKHRSWHIHEAILIALLLGFLGERARDNSVPEGRGEVLRFCTAASALLIHYSHHSETLYIASLFTSYCPPFSCFHACALQCNYYEKGYITPKTLYGIFNT